MSNGMNLEEDPVEAAVCGPEDEIIYDGSHRKRFSFEDVTKSLSIKRSHLISFIKMIETDPALVREIVVIAKMVQDEVDQGHVEASSSVKERYLIPYRRLKQFATDLEDVAPDNFLLYMKDIAEAYIIRKYGDEQSKS